MTTCRRVLALLPLLAVAACGSGVAADDDALTAGAPTEDALVLQVVRAGGFLPVGAAFRSVPSVSLYADGRVVTEGPQIELWPAPALPSVQVGELAEDEVQRLVDAGRALVDAQDDYGSRPSPTPRRPRWSCRTATERGVAAAVALEELSGEAAPADGAGLTGEQVAARERLSAFVREVQDAAAQALRRSRSRAVRSPCWPSPTATRRRPR